MRSLSLAVASLGPWAMACVCMALDLWVGVTLYGILGGLSWLIVFSRLATSSPRQPSREED